MVTEKFIDRSTFEEREKLLIKAVKSWGRGKIAPELVSKVVAAAVAAYRVEYDTWIEGVYKEAAERRERLRSTYLKANGEAWVKEWDASFASEIEAHKAEREARRAAYNI